MSIVSVLSENKDQLINKVLYKKGEARLTLAYHESLQSVERAIALVSVTENAGVRDAVTTVLKSAVESPILGADRALDVTDTNQQKRDLLKAKQASIRQLYSAQFK